MSNWQNTAVLVNADRTDDGLYNINLMTDSPAKDWIISLGADWYLSSIDELSLLWHNRYHVNKTARTIGSTLLSRTHYWSSTEHIEAYAIILSFANGSAGYYTKSNTYNVRAIRAF